MTTRLDQIFAGTDLRTQPLIAMHVVMATRLSILFLRAERDPLPDLAVRLRSMQAAQAQQALVMLIRDIWPESFAARRPCCMIMSPDEMLLADVAKAAMQGNRAAANYAMGDLLPASAHDLIFQNMVELVGAIMTASTLNRDDPL